MTLTDQVAADLKERERKGIAEYGRPLAPHNGRSALQDAYEEALDLACYLKQALMETDLRSHEPPRNSDSDLPQDEQASAGASSTPR